MKDLKGQDDFENSVKVGFSLVDFWAPWCAPCNAMAPLLEKVEADILGNVAFYKLNVDDEQNHLLSVGFQVRGIPMLIIFKDGLEVARNVGAFASAEALRNWVDGALKNHQ